MNLNIHPPLPGRKDFRVGILGSGFIVNDCHLVAYRKAGFNPVAIASRRKENAERAAKQHGIAKVYDNYAQLLDDPSIEVLDIAVPPNAQLDLIKAVCARKTVKGILAQKPLGMNYAEALEAVLACEAAGITLAVNQNMRYDHSVRAGKTLLENGTIGNPVFATIEMRAIPHWMPWQKDLGWLTLRIMSIHHLDTFRYWFGDPEGIYCSVRPDPRTKFSHADGICTYILEYANGLRCVAIDDTWAGPAKEGCASENYIKWRIEGSNGLAIGDIGWCKDPFTTPSDVRYASRGHEHFECPKWKESWFPDAFVGTMAQLLIALETGTEPAISGRDNLKTMALVEAAYLSTEEFRSIGVADFTKGLETRFGRPQASVKKGVGLFSRLFAKPENSVPETKAPADISENLTPRAQQALKLARKEANRLYHNFVGTEHVLLGLIALGQGVSTSVLTKLGLDLAMLRVDVEEFVGKGPEQRIIGEIPFTPRVKKVCSLAAKEAKGLNHTYIGTEHLLLGLIREGDGVAARVLKNRRVDIEKVREEILRELDPNSPSSSAGTSSSEVREKSEGPPGFAEREARFSFDARFVIKMASREAERCFHDVVSSEHLLVALARLALVPKPSVVAKVLENNRLDHMTLAAEVEKQLPADPRTYTGKFSYAQSFMEALASAESEAKRLNCVDVGTEHLLLGIIGEPDSARLLTNMYVDPKHMRAEILKELGLNPPTE